MGFLSPKRPQAQEPERLTSVQVNQSAYGRAVPLAYGQCRVAINMLWYSDFVATAIQMKQGGGGKGGGGGRSTSTSYEYSASFILGVCEGPIASMPAMFMDKSVASPATFGFTVFLGTATQAVWSHLISEHSSPEQIPYNLHAYIAVNKFNLGASAALPNLSVVVNGLLIEGGGGHANSNAEPSQILIDYCTSPTHGCNFNFLDSTGFTTGAASWRTYCRAMEYFISPLEVEQRPAVDFINYLLQITNSAAVWSAGKLKVIPYGDETVVGAVATYVPNLTPVYSFGDDDYLFEQGEDPVVIVLKPTARTFNSVKIEFLDSTRDFNPAVVDAKDDSDILFNGLRQMPTINMHAITRPDLAKRVAQIALQRNLYVRQYFKFRVRFDYCLLEPMDLVAITDSTAGIENVLVRVIEIDDSSDDVLSLMCEEVPVGPAGAPLYNTELAAGYKENYYADPGNVQDPIIFQIPPLLAQSVNRYLLAIGIAGSGPMWAGCDVYVSFDDLRYQFFGTHFGPSRYGSLVNPLPLVADPDLSSVLRVQLADTRLELADGSTEDADENRTICYVDGEIISYRDSTLTSTPGQYDLSYLRRGQYGSINSAHTAGARKFARLDQSLFAFAFDPGMIGRTMYFKFASFNIFGVRSQSIDTLVPYTHVITGAFSPTPLNDNATFIPRGTCGVAGNRLFKSAATTTPAFDGSNVYSLEGYSEGAAISFRANETTAETHVGFNGSPITDTDPTGLPFAWHLLPGGVLQIQSNGTDLLATPLSYTDMTLLEANFDGQVVKFLRDGVLVLQLPRATQSPQFFDSYFKNPSSSIRDVKYVPLNRSATVPFVARNTAFANVNMMGKVTTGADAYDSDVYSSQAYAEGCSLSFQPTQTTALFLIGLNSDPTTDQNFTGIDYAWHCNATPDCVIYENGTLILNCGSYTTDTVLSIRYDGQNVQYLKNGVVQRQVEAIGKTLFFDSSWRTPGGQARNVVFDQLNPGPQVPFIATGNGMMVTRDGARIRCEAPPAFSSGGFYSRESHANGCIISFQAEQLGSPVSSSCDIGLDTTPLAGGFIDYAWALFAANTVVLKDGSVVAAFAAHTLDTVLQIAYDGKFVSFIRDGIIVKQFPDPDKVFFARGSLLTNGPDRGIRNLKFEPFGITTPDPFIARGNCRITGNTIEKSGGASAWDSDVYSLVGFPTCHVQFKTSVASGTNRFMIGLSSNPQDSLSFTGIQYALYANGTTLEIYESGSLVSSHGAITTRTLLSMTFDGSNIRYFKDDVLIRGPIAASGNKFFDSSFFDPGTKVNGIEFGPGTIVPKLDTLQLFPDSATNLFVTTQPGTIIITAIAMTTMQSIFSVSVPAMSRAYGAAVNCDFGLSASSPGVSVYIVASAGTPSSSVKKLVTGSNGMSMDFNIPAATPVTFTLMCDNNGAANAFFNSSVMKAEVIKA